MTVDTLLMFTGALVAILPFLGFPNSWDRIFFLLLGILVVALGVVVRRRGLKRSGPEYGALSEDISARHEEETLAH